MFFLCWKYVRLFLKLFINLYYIELPFIFSFPSLVQKIINIMNMPFETWNLQWSGGGISSFVCFIGASPSRLLLLRIHNEEATSHDVVRQLPPKKNRKDQRKRQCLYCLLEWNSGKAWSSAIQLLPRVPQRVPRCLDRPAGPRDLSSICRYKLLPTLKNHDEYDHHDHDHDDQLWYEGDHGEGRELFIFLERNISYYFEYLLGFLYKRYVY